MKFTTLAVAAAMTLGLAGCGGGDGGDTPPPAVVTGAGFYTGTVGDNDDTKATTMAFDDGSFYMLFSDSNSTPTNPGIGAFIVGTGTYNNGSFTSTNANYFQSEAGFPVTVSASYMVKKSISGNITRVSPPATLGFSGNYDATYEATPSLPTIAGTFTGGLESTQEDENGSTDDVTFNISTAGAITGSGDGCSFSGTAKPKTSGNAYDVQLTMGAAPCMYPGKTLSGIATYGDALVVMTTSPDKAGVIFAGMKAAPK